MVERKVTIISCLYVMAVASLSVLCSLEKRKFDRLIPPSFCTSTTCPPQRNFKPRQQLCSFSCPDGLFYKCLENGEEEHVTEFCAPSLECEPGRKGVFTIDSNDPTKVVMSAEMCPSDSYQRYTSDCIHACTSKRDDFTFLTERFVLFSKGSNILPPEVYCNYTDGYYNPNNITLLDFDEEFQFYFGTYCVHVSEKDPCEKGFMPLPNGTCIRPCPAGYARDDHDNFICKLQTNKSSVPIGAVEKTETTSGSMITTETKGDDKAGNSNSTIFIIVVSVLTVVVIVLVVILVCYCVRNKRNTGNETQEGNIEELNSSQDLELQSLDESADKDLDNPEETKSLLDKADELPHENGIKQHTVEINSEDKSQKPKSKEQDCKSSKNGSVRNSNHIDSIENNYKANTQHFHFYNGQSHPDAANAWKEKEMGRLAGELKKKQDDTLTTILWDAMATQHVSVGCLIVYGENCGTVFRVGTCYAMTAFHIFSDIVRIDGQNEEDQFDLSKLTDDEIYVNFNTSVTDKPRILSTLTCVFYNKYLDVAVLKFDLISDLPQKMVLERNSFLNPKTVNIIGHGHPDNTSKKKIDPSCEVIPASSDRILQAHAWLGRNIKFYKEKVADANVVDAGYYGYDDSHKIILNCYLEHGASGAPLLTVDIKGCVQVVGILTHGMPEFYFHLSPQDQRAFPTEYRFEYGTRMKDIYNAIQETNPDLAKDL